MKKIIALDDGVKGLQPQLEQEGFQVVPLNEKTTEVDAFIISGMDENILGDATRAGNGFLINARGRQPEEIIYDLNKHFNLQD